MADLLIKTIDENGQVVFKSVSEILGNTDINIAKQNKIDEMSSTCKDTIYGSFKSTAYQGIEKIYGSTIEDQANITANALSALTGSDKFYYHAKDEDFVEWTVEQCSQLAKDFNSFKETQLFKCKSLQNYINTLNVIEDVNAITWDTVIPS